MSICSWLNSLRRSKPPSEVENQAPTPPAPAPRPVEKLLWVPFAVRHSVSMPTHGQYRKGYPEGAVVHFTAGRPGPGTVDYGARMGYCYFLIDEDGTLYQSFPLDRWGYHAGDSNWPGLGSGVSEYLVGIEMAAAGRVDPLPDGSFETWFKTKLSANQVRFSKGEANIQRGYYHKYTDAQERTLEKLLLWLKSNNPEVFSFDFVIGHDECAPKRKNDPGAALSMTMPEFRKRLKSIYLG